MPTTFRKLLLSGALLAASICAFAAPGQPRKPTDRVAAQAKGNSTQAVAERTQAEPATTAAPLWQTNAEGKKYRISAPADDTDAAQLEALLLPTIQYNVQDIYFLSPPQFPPRFDTTSTVFEGQAILPVPIVRRYAIDENGHTDVRYRAEALQPNGQTEAGPEEIILFSGSANTQGQLLFPADSIATFYTDDSQEAGTYVLRIILSDKISGAEITLEQAIEVIPYKEPELPADFDSNQWMKGYYRSPQPALALPALYAMMQEVPQERFDGITAPMLGFYNAILTQNRWLLPHFSARLEQALDKVREGGDPDNADIMLGLILSFHLRNETEKPQTISERIWEETQSNREFDWSYTDPYAGQYIYYPHQLDFLWGEFFATSSYRSVNRLLEALFQDKEAAAAATPEALLRLSAEQREALTEAVRDAVHWSLLSNGREQRQLLAYLFGTAMTTENALSEQDRKQLQAMLHAIILADKEQSKAAPPSDK